MLELPGTVAMRLSIPFGRLPGETHYTGAGVNYAGLARLVLRTVAGNRQTATT